MSDDLDWLLRRLALRAQNPAAGLVDDIPAARDWQNAREEISRLRAGRAEPRALATDAELVEVARDAARDEYGSHLCVWHGGVTRVCRKEMGASLCICEAVATAVLAAIAPRIRAAAMEQAAKVADSFTCGGCGMDGKCAAAIRALASEAEGGK